MYIEAPKGRKPANLCNGDTKGLNKRPTNASKIPMY
jgi:hypothetical protein